VCLVWQAERGARHLPQSGRQLCRDDSAAFEHEGVLQSLIAQHPEMLTTDERPLLLVRREALSSRSRTAVCPSITSTSMRAVCQRWWRSSRARTARSVAGWSRRCSTTRPTHVDPSASTAYPRGWMTTPPDAAPPPTWSPNVSGSHAAELRGAGGSQSATPCASQAVSQAGLSGPKRQLPKQVHPAADTVLGRRQQGFQGFERRGWDSNPRSTKRPTTVFETRVDSWRLGSPTGIPGSQSGARDSSRDSPALSHRFRARPD
jgi:hypothetical protein